MIDIVNLHECNTINKITYNFYVTTIICNSLKKQYSNNVINNKKFTPLVSISNSIEYSNIEMPNWDDFSEKINNFKIWDLYRNSLEWLTYIFDIGIQENNNSYMNFCITTINSWLSKFIVPGKYHSKLIWCDHAVSCRINVFLKIFDCLRYTKLLSKINNNLVDVLKTHIDYLYIWVKNNNKKVNNHILIACISIIYYNLYFEITNKEMLDYTLDIIEKYIISNFKDGINIENSPGYQFHVLVYLIRFFYFITKIEKQKLLTDTMKQIIEESLIYLNIFKRNNLTIPVIGDSNLTLDIFASYDEEYNNLDNMIKYLNDKNIIIIKKNTLQNTFNLIVKKETGYIFLLENDIQMIIRYNPLIYNWHTHNDQLSINYFRDGIDWITDVGSYPDKKDFCTSRIAHNILLRNMENINTIKDDYDLEIINNKHIIIKLENNAFIHKREIIWKDIDNFTIIDDVKNKNINEMSIFNQIFHLNHNISVKQHNNNIVYLKYKDNNLKIEQYNNTQLKIYNGSEKPFIGWVCYNASKLEKTNTLVFNSNNINKTKFITKFNYIKENNSNLEQTLL